MVRTVHEETSETRKTHKSRHKLRRLAKSTDHGDANKDKTVATRKETHPSARRTFLRSMLVALVVALVFTHNSKCVFRGFVNSYRRHLYQIVHGRQDYCDQSLDTQALMERISADAQILNQAQALQKLELALRNDSRVNAIALVGPSGVGKSLWARALQQHFPWRENVHAYAWNTYVRNEAEKFHVLRLFVENLSDCGRNLLIIENLTPCDREVVAILNKILLEGGEEGYIEDNMRILVIYVFNLNSMEEEAVYAETQEALQQLPHTKTINFSAFGVKELADCVHREAQLENYTLNEQQFLDVMETVDVARAGCKTVNAKVLTYGERRKAV